MDYSTDRTPTLTQLNQLHNAGDLVSGLDETTHSHFGYFHCDHTHAFDQKNNKFGETMRHCMPQLAREPLQLLLPVRLRIHGRDTRNYPLDCCDSSVESEVDVVDLPQLLEA